MRAIILMVVAVMAAGAGRADLHGRVVDREGKAIPGATAYVYTAGVKKGTSTFCPSCYPDCGKTGVTDSGGEFAIASLDPELKFRVLFVAEGYKPAIVAEVDPAAGKVVEVKLEGAPKGVDPARVLKGRVVDMEGKPVLGAIVEPRGCKTQTQRWWGSMPGVDPMSITNARGEFQLVSEEPAIAFDVIVEARGLATKNFALLPLGEKPHELVLGQGATVVGRLMREGKPMAGVSVGLVQKSRGVENFTGARTVGTDGEGRFTFLNVAPAGEWLAYGIMKEMPDGGAIKVEPVHVTGEGSTSDAGDLVMGKAFTLSGRVVLSDGGAVPADTKLQLSRQSAWDSEFAVLDRDGRFTLKGIPAETVHVSVRVNGYRLSAKNKSLNLLNLTFLEGKVDSDISDLTILMEPGKVTAEDLKRGRDEVMKGRVDLREMRIEGVKGE